MSKRKSQDALAADDNKRQRVNSQRGIALQYNCVTPSTQINKKKNKFCGYGPLNIVASYCDFKTFVLLHSTSRASIQSIDPKALKRKWTFDDAMVLLRRKNTILLKKVIEKKCLDTNEMQKLLFEAIYFSRNEIAMAIMNYKEVDPSVNNNSALIRACRNNNVEIVSELLKHEKVDATIDHNKIFSNDVCECGDMPMFSLFLNHKNVNLHACGETAFGNACSGYIGSNRLQIVIELLKQPGVDPSAQNNAPLIGACRKNNLSIAIELLKFPGVDTSACNNAPLRMACNNRAFRIAIELMKYENVDPAAKNSEAVLATCHYKNKNKPLAVELAGIFLQHKNIDPYRKNEKTVEEFFELDTYKQANYLKWLQIK